MPPHSSPQGVPGPFTRRKTSAASSSTNPGRIAENIDVFDFELSADQLAQLDALDSGVRSGPDPDVPRPEMFDRVIPES